MATKGKGSSSKSKTGTARKGGALSKVGKAVKQAAKAAENYVVNPVGKALGMTGKKKTTAKSSTPKKAKTAKSGTTKKGSSKSTSRRK